MASPTTGPRGSRPNIVVIDADDMGYGDVACYNRESKIPTPNMDRLAAAGTRFTDAHSSSAVCTPSRYGLLTGQYCWRTDFGDGVVMDYEDGCLIDEDRVTLGGMLQEEGYRTACVGKWHLGMDWPRREVADPEFDCETIDFTRPFEDGPTAHGFDYFFGIRASLDMPPYCFIENDHTVGVPSVEKDPYNDQQRAGLMVPGWRDEAVGPRITERAVNFVAEQGTARPDQPFFLYVPTSAPHRPCTPPSFIQGRSDAGPRGDMVTQVDWTVGQIDAALASYGLREETLFVVTSDNGARATCYDGRDYGHASNGDLRGKKADIWDGGHREPFIVRWPGVVESGRACDETICHTDLLATVAELAGATLPDEAGEDSYDMTPALLGEDYQAPIREATIHHSLHGHLAIRQGPWKLIPERGSGGFSEPIAPDHDANEPSGQLYNLADDPRERDNRWTARPDVVESLLDLLAEYKTAGRSAPRGTPRR